MVLNENYACSYIALNNKNTLIHEMVEYCNFHYGFCFFFFFFKVYKATGEEFLKIAGGK